MTSSLLLSKINQWMYGIRKAIARCGINTGDSDPLANFRDDPLTMQEIHYHLDELLYTLSEISDYIEREKLKDSKGLATQNDALADWANNLQMVAHRYKAHNGLTS